MQLNPVWASSRCHKSRNSGWFFQFWANKALSLPNDSKGQGIWGPPCTTGFFIARVTGKNKRDYLDAKKMDLISQLTMSLKGCLPPNGWPVSS